MTRLENYDLNNTFKATLKESIFITPENAAEEVRQLKFEIDRGGLQFELGQSLAVLVPGPHEFGNEYHTRLYSVAGVEEKDGRMEIELAVRRCSYIDDVSGERYQGVASNYLCDLKVGAEVMMAGPFGAPFEIPEENTSNILMIGVGTGIAPFRVFAKRIYQQEGGWQGKVRLFYGAKSGLELLYMNDQKNDFSNYYDQATFKAFESVSSNPVLDPNIPIERTLEENSKEVWELVNDANTYVYIAGLEKVREQLDSAFAKMAGSAEKWSRKKAEITAGKRWTELLY